MIIHSFLSRYGTLLLTLAVILGPERLSQATEQRVASPDGTLLVVIADDDGLSFRVEVDGKPTLTQSQLGMEFDGGIVLGPTAKIEHARPSAHDGAWENRFGKRRNVRDCWRQVHLDLVESGNPQRRFGLIVRVFDDGVALRYDLPEASGLSEFTLLRELTQFTFAGDYPCWAGEPSNCAENQYLQRTLETIPVRGPAGSVGNDVYLSVLPLLVQTPNCLVAIAESDLLDWAGMFVTGTGSPAVGVVLAPRNDGRGCVVSRTPARQPLASHDDQPHRSRAGRLGSDRESGDALPPERYFVDQAWHRGLGPLVDRPQSPAPPIPRRTARGDTKAHKEYIDLAAEMDWTYQLVDWFWYENMSSYDVTLNMGGPNVPRPPVDFTKSVSHIDMPAILEYAKQRGVRPLIWLHSYDVHRYGIEKACALLAGWGAAGMKIDFMNSDSQETVKWYEDVIATAARYQLTVDFHGAYKPTGLARTYPNYITQEGVLGNEYNKLDGNKCTPLHTITLPFTRGLLGPMDFTPGGFLNVPVVKFQITQPAEVMGTRAARAGHAGSLREPTDSLLR